MNTTVEKRGTQIKDQLGHKMEDYSWSPAWLHRTTCSSVKQMLLHPRTTPRSCVDPMIPSIWGSFNEKGTKDGEKEHMPKLHRARRSPFEARSDT
jgi:hypothetical protein